MDLAARLAEHAATFGQRPFLVDAATGSTLCYADVVRLAERLDAALEPGSVGLAIDGSARYAAGYAALLAAGRTVVPLAPGAPAAESRRTLQAAGCSLVLDGDEPAAVRRSASDGLPAPVVIPGGGVVMFTSGTTGAPKGVALRTDQLWRNAGCVAEAHEFTPDDVGLCPLPLWHINAQVVGVLAALRAGATLVVDGGFHRSRFWASAHAHRVTWVNAAPAIVHMLAAGDPGPDGPPPLGLRFVRSASAPLPRSARERFEARFGVPVVESYGMTEAAGMITVNSLHRARKPGSAGRPAGVELRIADADRRALPAGAVGEVHIRGASVIEHYLRGADAQRFSADGWLVTGDLGCVDADGDVFLAGRADDVINRGGELVHPREVEEVLLGHPDVSAVAVVGVDDERLGERVVALVVARVPDGTAGPPPAEELIGQLTVRCARELSAYKRPGEYRLVEQLPMGGTGKVRHRQARDLAAGLETVAR